MSARQRRGLHNRRRRVEDDGEEEGSVVLDVGESGSEGSVLSEDADAENSDTEETTSPQIIKVGSSDVKDKANGVAGKLMAAPRMSPQETAFASLADTEAMMNGLDISKDVAQGAETVDFDAAEELGAPPAQSNEPPATVPEPPTVVATKAESAFERRRREHEEYRKKRDTEPTFVPNRGGFFMHDHRSAGPSHNGFRPFGRGNGRGKGAVGGPFSPAA